MGKFTAYNLPLKSLPTGTHEFEYRLGRQFFVDMEDADIHDADVSAGLVVTYRGDVYDLRFTLKGEITLICDRCLDDLVWPVDTTYHVMVKYGDSFNDDNDELLVIPESDNNLNVAYMLHDTVALTIPIKHVHPQGKCNRQMSALLKKHRARATGEDAVTADEEDTGSATDPRWDALKNITDHDSAE